IEQVCSFYAAKTFIHGQFDALLVVDHQFCTEKSQTALTSPQRMFSSLLCSSMSCRFPKALYIFIRACTSSFPETKISSITEQLEQLTCLHKLYITFKCLQKRKRHPARLHFSTLISADVQRTQDSLVRIHKNLRGLGIPRCMHPQINARQP